MNESALDKYSATSLATFRLCPSKFWHQFVAKRLVVEDSPALRRGRDEHKRLEDQIKRKPAPRGPGAEVVEALLKLQDAGRCTVEAERRFEAPFGAWRLVGRIDVLCMAPDYSQAAIVDWKGLALDTEIPTPSGFRLMHELRVGDEVFDGAGKPTRVAGLSEIKQLPCFEVETSNGIRVVCDHEHLWLRESRTQSATRRTTEVVGVRDLRPRDRIPLCAPVEYAEKELPIDPWVFGLWLADGKHTSSEISKPDPFIWQEIARRGYELGKVQVAPSGCPSRTVLGISRQLRALGVIGNKHVPDVYRFGSVEQRRLLVQGFCDGGGYANPVRHQMHLSGAREGLTRVFAEIIRSLGERVVVIPHKARGFGLEIDVWTIAFNPQTFNPFRLPRKAEVLKPGSRGNRFNDVRAIREVPSVPTRCISVESPLRTYLCTRGYLVTHNTGGVREDPFELEVHGLGLSCEFPDLRAVTGRYYWLAEARPGALHKVEPARVEDEVRNLVADIEASTFEPKRNWSCRKYCGVTECRHHGK